MLGRVTPFAEKEGKALGATKVTAVSIADILAHQCSEKRKVSLLRLCKGKRNRGDGKLKGGKRGGFRVVYRKNRKKGGGKEKGRIDEERGKQGVPERNGETESKGTEKKFSLLQKNQKGRREELK